MEQFTQELPSRLSPVARELAAAARAEPRIEAAWLEGSIAAGTCDEWSDLDVHLLVPDPSEFDVVEWVSSVAPLAMSDAIPGLSDGFIFVTPEWIQVDIVLHTDAAELDPDAARLVMFAAAQHAIPAPRNRSSASADAYFPEDLVLLFLYFVGDAAIGLRRNDLIALARIVAQLREALVALLLAENGMPGSHARKRADCYLNAEQLEQIRRLPPIGLHAAGLTASLETTAEMFVDRARRLASECGAQWPDRFFDATRSFVKDVAGISI